MKYLLIPFFLLASVLCAEDFTVNGKAPSQHLFFPSEIADDATEVEFCFRYRWQRTITATNEGESTASVLASFQDGQLVVSLGGSLLEVIDFADEAGSAVLPADGSESIRLRNNSGFVSMLITDPGMIALLQGGAPIEIESWDLATINGPANMLVDVDSFFTILGSIE